mgnify:CR=1 FL=1
MVVVEEVAHMVVQPRLGSVEVAVQYGTATGSTYSTEYGRGTTNNSNTAVDGVRIGIKLAV